MSYFKKKIKKSELAAIDVLIELGIIDVVYPNYLIRDGFLFTEKCTQYNNFSIELFIQTINFCVEKVYNKKFDYYTTGIYSFIPSTQTYLSQSNYFKNLKFELLNLTNKLSIEDRLSCSINTLISILEIYEHNNYDIKFSLLHGDLHSGNIVLKNGDILLIDWEYLSIGLPEIEISYFYLLFLINNSYDESMQRKLLCEIKKSASKWNINYDILVKVFIPYICLCLLICTKNNLIQNQSFSEKELSKLLNNFIEGL